MRGMADGSHWKELNVGYSALQNHSTDGKAGAQIKTIGLIALLAGCCYLLKRGYGFETKPSCGIEPYDGSRTNRNHGTNRNYGTNPSETIIMMLGLCPILAAKTDSRLK
jgi:hypothetical protein